LSEKKVGRIAPTLVTVTRSTYSPADRTKIVS